MPYIKINDEKLVIDVVGDLVEKPAGYYYVADIPEGSAIYYDPDTQEFHVDLDEDKAKKIDDIEKAKYDYLFDYFWFKKTDTGVYYKIPSNRSAQIDIIGLYIFSKDVDTTMNIPFFTYDDEEIIVSAADIQSMFVTGATYKTLIHNKAKELKDLISQCTVYNCIDVIDENAEFEAVREGMKV